MSVRLLERPAALKILSALQWSPPKAPAAPITDIAGWRLLDDINCPLPLTAREIQIQHGAGGRLTRELIQNVFVKHLKNEFLEEDHDSVAIRHSVGDTGAWVISNDTFVIRPLFFPGGNIGKLAVCGTVNDLAMSGAIPKVCTLGVILEEGFCIENLQELIKAFAATARLAGMKVAAGDTKVVERGKGDGVYLAITGIGEKITASEILPRKIANADAIIVTGDLGRHGATILAVREGLTFSSMLESDCALLDQPIAAMLRAGVEVHCMRDCTRGGLATALNELALKSGLSFLIDQSALTVRPEVEAVCELYGLDPLYMANEGCALIILPAGEVSKALGILQEFPETRFAKVVGTVFQDARPQVTLKNDFGTERILDYLAGDMLPRIC